jgi:ferredoxin
MNVKINFHTAAGGSATVTVEKGTNLLEAAALAGVAVEGNCGGKGTCGKCKVRLLQKSPAAPTGVEKKLLSEEELAGGWALACQRVAETDMDVEVPEQSDAFRRKILLSEDDREIAVEPAVNKIELTLVPPTVEDQTPDLERLLGGLPGEHRIDISRRLLSELPQILRHEKFTVTAVLAEKGLIAVEPGRTGSRLYGVAFDIGTTTIMGSLHDLNSGKTLSLRAATNPQNIYGADVISRITYAAESPEGLARMQGKVVEALNEIIRGLAAEAGIEKEQIYEATAVGNTTTPQLIENLQAVFPELTGMPHQDTLSRLLEKTDVETIESIYIDLLKQLIAKKKFKHLLHKGRYLVAVDGTQKYVMSECADERYLRRSVPGTENEYQYYAYVLEAVLIFSNGMVLPLLSEFLENSPELERIENDDKWKQDCELKAFYRLAARLKRMFPRLRLTLLLDGLYANGPVMEICRKNKWGFAIVLKDGSLPTVWREAKGLMRLDTEGECRHEQIWRGRRQIFRWVNEIEYDYEQGGRKKRLKVHLVTCEESWLDIDKNGTEITSWLPGSRYLCILWGLRRSPGVPDCRRSVFASPNGFSWQPGRGICWPGF